MSNHPSDPMEVPSELLSPFLPIPSLSNFRDIGGWHISSPICPYSTVKSRILYRGPDPTAISPLGLSALDSLNITRIFDLRSTPQIERAGGVKEFEGIKGVPCPVFEDSEYSAEKAGERYIAYSSDGTEEITKAFMAILEHGAKPAFLPILKWLAEWKEGDGACLVHCTTGNNRSGVFIGVLLSFLGVSDEAVATEYALSEEGLRGERDVVVERLLRNPGFKKACGEGAEGRRRAERMVGARGESMLALLEEVGRVYGGAERWVRDVVGLSEEEVGRVREVLTENRN